MKKFDERKPLFSGPEYAVNTRNRRYDAVYNFDAPSPEETAQTADDGTGYDPALDPDNEDFRFLCNFHGVVDTREHELLNNMLPTQLDEIIGLMNGNAREREKGRKVLGLLPDPDDVETIRREDEARTRALEVAAASTYAIIGNSASMSPFRGNHTSMANAHLAPSKGKTSLKQDENSVLSSFSSIAPE